MRDLSGNRGKRWLCGDRNYWNCRNCDWFWCRTWNCRLDRMASFNSWRWDRQYMKTPFLAKKRSSHSNCLSRNRQKGRTALANIGTHGLIWIIVPDPVRVHVSFQRVNFIHSSLIVRGTLNFFRERVATLFFAPLDVHAHRRAWKVIWLPRYERFQII